MRRPTGTGATKETPWRPLHRGMGPHPVRPPGPLRPGRTDGRIRAPGAGRRRTAGTGRGRGIRVPLQRRHGAGRLRLVAALRRRRRFPLHAHGAPGECLRLGLGRHPCRARCHRLGPGPHRPGGGRREDDGRRRPGGDGGAGPRELPPRGRRAWPDLSRHLRPDRAGVFRPPRRPRRHAGADRRQEPRQRRTQPARPLAPGPGLRFLQHGVRAQPHHRRAAAQDRLLHCRRRRRRAGAGRRPAGTRLPPRGALPLGHPGQRLPAHVAARSGRLRRAEAGLAAGPGRRRHRHPRSRPGRSPRLLHHRRTAQLRSHGPGRGRPGRPLPRRRHGGPGRRAARQSFRRPQGQGSPGRRHGRVHARHGGHAIVRRSRDIQVPGAELAGVFNMGGSVVANYVSVLERAA